MNLRPQARLYLAVALTGAVFVITLNKLHHVPVTHAQDDVVTFPGCLSNVPKSWGKFVGASSYGLAFEDDRGTLRFVQHPACSSNSSAINPPTALSELEIVRK